MDYSEISLKGGEKLDYDNDDRVERIFNQEVAEKKKTATGARHMASRKKGFKGAMSFPYEMLPAKQKKLYMSAGEVESYNMYTNINNIPTLDEISQMPKEAARDLIIKLRNMHKTRDLMDKWGFKSYDTLNKRVLNVYGVPKASYSTASKKESKSSQGTPQQKPAAAPAETPAVPIQKLFSGFKIMLVGSYTGEEIESRATALLMTLQKDSKYTISLEITEVHK